MIVAKGREKSTESRQIAGGNCQENHQKSPDCCHELPKKLTESPRLARLNPIQHAQPTKKPRPQPATGARFKSDYFADLSSDFASSSSSIAEMTTLPSTKSADNAFLPGLSK